MLLCFFPLATWTHVLFILFFFLIVMKSTKQNFFFFHKTKFMYTIFKYIVQWHHVHLHCCTIATIHLQKIFTKTQCLKTVNFIKKLSFKL